MKNLALQATLYRDSLLAIYGRLLAATNAADSELWPTLHDIQVIVEETVPAEDLAKVKWDGR